MGDTASGPSPAELEAALRLFDETTRALDARARRLEEVLTVKQRELLEANNRLAEQLAEVDRLSAWLNLLLASVGSGVIAVDQAGRISTCNPAAEAACAGLGQDLIASDYRALFPDSPIDVVLTEREARAQWSHRVPGIDGRPRLLDGTISPIRDGEGRLLGAVEVFEDVTEVERLREQAERGERLRALGEMAAGVAHEIRNPLNGIEGFASLLQRDLPADDKRARYAESIVSGVRHLNSTVTGLLEYTRPKMPDVRPVPMAELLASCLDLLRAELQQDDAGAELTLDDDGAIERWPCDPTQIRQVLLNLMQNGLQSARERMGDEARLRVGLTVVAGDAGRSCQISIDDNGSGVPAAERQQIFTPFFTTKERGTGLGLAVSHNMVNLHGGSIVVEDSDLGGARFRLLLPG